MPERPERKMFTSSAAMKALEGIAKGATATPSDFFKKEKKVAGKSAVTTPTKKGKASTENKSASVGSSKRRREY